MVTAEWDSAFERYVYLPSIRTQSSDLFGRVDNSAWPSGLKWGYWMCSTPLMLLSGAPMKMSYRLSSWSLEDQEKGALEVSMLGYRPSQRMVHIWRFSKDFLVETGNVVKVCKSLLHFLIVKHSLATSGKRMLTALLKWNLIIGEPGWTVEQIDRIPSHLYYWQFGLWLLPLICHYNIILCVSGRWGCARSASRIDPDCSTLVFF